MNINIYFFFIRGKLVDISNIISIRQILREILYDYQHYKYPKSINITSPSVHYSFRIEPRLVTISLNTVMFHRIHKVGMRLKQTELWLTLSPTFHDRAAKLDFCFEAQIFLYI